MACRHVGEDGPVRTIGPGLEGVLVPREGLQDGVVVQFDPDAGGAAAERRPGCPTPSR